MKTSLCLFCLLLLTGLAFSAETPQPLELIARGASPYVIAVAEEGDAACLKEAASLLASTIAEATGVALPVVKESALPAGAPAIHLGKSKAARRVGMPLDDLQGWAYRMRVSGRDVLLVGNDRNKTLPNDTIPDKTVQASTSGTYKAVTAFLERFAGVRFVLPGAQGTQVRKLASMQVDAALDVSWKPLLQYVVGRRVEPAKDRLFDPYAVANNFQGPYDIVCSYGGHSYPHVVPQEVYFKDHPEYFALINGRRDPTERNHLCISNPEVQQLMLKEMERRFDEGYEIVALTQSDGYHECECANCQAIHPEVAEKLWIVHRKLAEEMYRRRPKGKVMLASYTWTAVAPKTFDRFPPNVVIRSNRYTPEYFQAWSRFQTERHVFFPAWLGPNRIIAPRTAVDLVRLFLENKVRGIYLCGGLDCRQGSPWGLNGPAYYAFGKAMEDPELSADDLEAEYIAGAFGEAAKPMRVFFQTMHRRLEPSALIERRETGVDRTYRGYVFAMRPEDEFCHYFPPANLTVMSESLAQAKKLAVDPKVKSRLALLEAEFGVLREKVGAYHMYRAYAFAPGWETLKMVENQVQAYRDALDRATAVGAAPECKGLRKPFNGNAAGRFEFSRKASAPFGWDFKEIHAKKQLPVVDTEVKFKGGEDLEPYTFDPNRPPGTAPIKVPAKSSPNADKRKLFNETFDADGKTPFDR